MPMRGRRSLADNRVFFVTTATKGHLPLFSGRDNCFAIKEIISSYSRHHDIIIIGYVIMPTHLHLLLAVRQGGNSLSAFMRDIKRVSAKELAPSGGGVWESRFDDVAIISQTQFMIKLNYIHCNPVKAGLCDRPEDFEFSSAAIWVGREVDPFVSASLDFCWLSGEDA